MARDIYLCYGLLTDIEAHAHEKIADNRGSYNKKSFIKKMSVYNPLISGSQSQPKFSYEEP